MRPHRIVAVAAAFAVGAATWLPVTTADAAPTQYTIRLLQPSSSYQPHTVGTGVNLAGEVVGYSTDNRVEPTTYPLQWPAATRKPTQLGKLAARQAVGITATGRVGGNNTAVGTLNGFWHDPAQGDPGLEYEQAPVVLGAVNETAGAAYGPESGESTRIFRVSDRGELTPVVDSATPNLQALGISPNGKIIAGSKAKVATLWVGASERALALPRGYRETSARAVTDAGAAVGHAGSGKAAVRWAANGTASLLTNPTKLPYVRAEAVNSAGVAVGTASKIWYGDQWTDATYLMGRALLWEGNTGVDLNSRIAGRHDHYTLISALDINDKGQIVGTAKLNDDTLRAYLATPVPASGIDIYSTPGTYSINGREWTTTCEPYSQTERCRTDIWGTTVLIKNGMFVRENAWVFNNLTYAPSPRAIWKGNPLATPGNHTVNGRKWTTECDTAWTGRNGCRSSILSTVYQATPKPGGGYTFSQSEKYVFNNIARFR